MSIKFGRVDPTDTFASEILLTFDPHDPYASVSSNSFTYNLPIGAIKVSGQSLSFTPDGLSFAASSPVVWTFGAPVNGAEVWWVGGSEKRVQNGSVFQQLANANININFVDSSSFVENGQYIYYFGSKEFSSITLTQIVDPGWTSTGTFGFVTTPSYDIPLFTLGSFNFFDRNPGLVDFRSLTNDQKFMIAAGAGISDVGNADHTIYLPDAPFNVDQWLVSPGSYAGNPKTVTLGSGKETVYAGLTTEAVLLGTGENTIYAAPHLSSYTPFYDYSKSQYAGGTGLDKFDYHGGRFGDFSGFANGTVQTIKEGNHEFRTSSSQQDVIVLPGSPADYKFSVQFGPTWSTTVTSIHTNGRDGFPDVTLKASSVERVQFAHQIDNPVTLLGGSIAAEMLELAHEAYWYPVNFFATEPLASSTNVQPTEASKAEARAWHALSAMELGIAPADFGKAGNLQYSFANGVYQAFYTSGTLSGAPAEADAIVLIGLVHDAATNTDKTTLAISFRGTDQIADIGDWSNFADHYTKYIPLFGAISNYIDNRSNGIQQVLVSGHSLGAAAVDYFMYEFPDTAQYKIRAYTDGSPGIEYDIAAEKDNRITNFINVDDPVPILGDLTNRGADTDQLKFAIAAMATLAFDLPTGIDVGLSLANLQPKLREGGYLIFDNDAPTGAEHDSGLYQREVAKLYELAADSHSPFFRESLAQTLVRDGGYGGPPITIGMAGVSTDDAVYNTVHIHPNDKYVFGVSGGTISWDHPSISEFHIVDGVGSAVKINGLQSLFTKSFVLTDIGVETDLYYLGKLIGEFFRVSDISFTNYLPTVQWAGSPDLGVRSPPYQVAGVGDFNNDHTDDILWRDPITGRLDEWHIVNGQWAGSTDLGSHGADWQVAGVGDLDGDGTGNILWRNPNTGQMDEWRMGNGNWAGSVPMGSHGADWQVAGIGDFNNDGTDDILWRNPSTGQMDEWRMSNGNWAGSLAFGSHGTDWIVAGIGDFNHDGNEDVLWRNPTTGKLDEWKLVNGQWAGSVDLGSFNSAWQVAAVKDFNGDGTADVLFRNPSTGQVEGWMMQNGQWAGSFSLGSMNPAFQMVGSGDFNHSFSADVLWRNPSTGQTGEWLLAPT
jgi:Protein of unknown function (DUF2974)